MTLELTLRAIVSLCCAFTSFYIAIEYHLYKKGDFQRSAILFFSFLGLVPIGDLLYVIISASPTTPLWYLSHTPMLCLQLLMAVLLRRKRYNQYHVRLTRIEESLEIAAVRLDKDLRIEWADEYLCEVFFGTQECLLVGKTLFELSTDNSVPILEELKKNIEYENVPFSVEYSVKSEHGIQHIFQANQKQFNADGKLSGIIAGIRNITAEKNAEELQAHTLKELQERDQMMGVAMKAAGMGTWEMHLSPQNIIFSERAAELLNIDSFAGTQSQWIELFGIRHRPMLHKSLGDALTLGIGFSLQVCTVKGVWVQISGTRTLNSDGEPLKLIGTIQDVTPFRKVQKRMEMLEQALLVLPETGVTISAITPDRSILYTNHHEASMHGWCCIHLVGRSVKVFVPETLHGFYEDFNETLLRGDPQESINVTKSGELFPVQCQRALLYDSAGKAYAVVSVCRKLSQAIWLERGIEHMSKNLEDPLYVIFLLTLPGKERKYQIDYICNPEILKVLGYKKEELMDFGIEKLFPEDMEFKRVMDRMAHPEKGPITLQVMTKSGERLLQRWVYFRMGKGLLAIGKDHKREKSEKIMVKDE